MKNRILLQNKVNDAKNKSSRLCGKKLPLVMLLLFLALGAKANPVETGRARQVATTFLNSNGSRSIGLTEVSSAAGFSNVYVFTTDNSFVLMAADDCVQPILGYSLTSRFDVENMPANKRAWIQGYSDAIQYAIEHQTRASAEVAQQWRDLAEGNSNINRATTVVAPLIQTQWDQGEPYNNLCPDGTVTGCAATALAQVLKYWNYPQTGIGMHSYQWNGQTVSADFGSTTYDWNNMLNSYSGSSTEAQRTAVATLMFHCGVSLDMNYGWAWSGGSGAYSSATAGALINYFNYSSETQLLSRSSYSETEWINMVKAELNLYHPIWYCGNGSGGGHAFVCDGYNSSNYFHFNWGWSGYCDEYYSLNNLAPGPGGIGSGSVGDFSNNQQAVFGAQPSPESSANAPVLTASLITEPGVRNAQLNWNQVDNAISYNVYRNGTLIHTTSSGSETSYLDVHIAYGTTTYYVRCLDENGILSWPSNYAPVTIIFPAPTNLTSVLVDGGVQLTWTPCEGAVAYNVYCNNGVLVNGVDQTSFYDNRPIAGELSYFVRGVDSFGDESESSDIATLNVPYSTPIVDDLESSVFGNTVALSWSAPDWCFPETPSVMLNYGSNDLNGWFGYNYGSTCWGHRYPASSLTAHTNMSIYKASFYARIAGDYELLVYEGTIDGHPQTLVRQQAVWIESEGWHDIVLPEKVQIDASLDYWVFFRDVNGLNHPATCCNYSGNEGNYYSRNPASGVNTIDGRAFLIHTYLTDGIYTYNLYRNGTCIANGFSNTYYNDNNLAPNIYEYYVKTNYYAGESPASNHVTAKIAAGNYYTITVSANPTEGGSVTGGSSYLEGNTCTLTATANPGYSFVNWTKDGVQVSTDASYSFIVTETGDYVANFEDIVYQITVAANPAEGGSVIGAGIYHYNQTCTLEATAAEGYRFLNWIKDGTEVSTESSYSFEVTESSRYVANFSEFVQIGDGTGTTGYFPFYTLYNYSIATALFTASEFETAGAIASTITGLSWYAINSTGYEQQNITIWMANVTDTEVSTTSPNALGMTKVYTGSCTPEIGWNKFIFNENHFTWDGQSNVLILCQRNNGSWNSTIQWQTHDPGFYAMAYKYTDNEAYEVESNSYDMYRSNSTRPNTQFEISTPNIEGSVTQTSVFSEGYTWWSTYIEQEGIEGLEMLEEGLGDNGITIYSQANGFTNYYEDYGWWGSLSSIDNMSSYKIKTIEPCSVALTGDEAVPSQHPITLSYGWTWIGYVSSTALDVNEALSGLEATVGDKLKSQEGYSEYYAGYGWYGSLSTIDPGTGLMYYSSNGDSVTFTYPDNGRGGELKQNLTSEHNHWKPNIYAYPDNMTVMAVVELEGAEISSDNYELAAFAANGECRGSVRLIFAEPLHRHVAFLTISGKDAAELSFRLYDTETGEEYDAAEESLSFVANALVGDADDLYTIHFRGTTGVDELANKVQVYPNPVNAGEQFIISIADDVKTPVRVEIVNALGVEMLRAMSEQTPVNIVAPTTSGVYTLRITVEGKGTVFRKLVVK